MIFKPKSPLGKQNARMGGFFNQYIKSGNANHYPNPPSPLSQNFHKIKYAKDQSYTDPNSHILPTFNRHATDDLNLQCDEVLEEIDCQNKKGREDAQNTLLCEEQLDNSKINDWKSVMISRMQKLLKAYQQKSQYLQEQNVSLKQQLQRERQTHYYHRK